MSFVPVRWLKLRFGFADPFVVMYASTSDEKHKKVYQRWDPLIERILYNLPITPPLWSHLDGILKHVTKGLPDSRPGPHSTGPVPAAVFLSPCSHPTLKPLLDFLAANLEEIFCPDRIQVAFLVKGRVLRREPFKLPLNITAVKPADVALHDFHSAPWLTDEYVRNFGARIKKVDSLEQALTRETPDILLTDQCRDVSSAIQRLPRKHRPRLVIGFGTPGDVEKIPGGTAWLWISTLPGTLDSRTFVTHLLYAILHDLPLHEAVKAAKRQGDAKRLSATLFADPLSIEYLRLTYVFADMHRRAHRWQTSLPQLDFNALVERLRRTEPNSAEKVRLAVEAAQRKEKHPDTDPDEAVQKAVKEAAQATTTLSKALSKIMEDNPSCREILTADSNRANELEERLANLSSHLRSGRVTRDFISRADLKRLMRITPVDSGIMYKGRGAGARKLDRSRIRGALKSAETIERIVTTPATNRQRYETWADRLRNLPSEFMDFRQESRGFVPMAEMEAEAADLKEAEGDLKATARELLENSEVKEILRRQQQRHADVALFRRTTDPLLLPMEKERTLATLAEYDLRFHIGNLQKESLMTGTPPAIDPLLPDPENERGYLLDVVLQPKDFRLLSPALMTLNLPVFGGSKPVYFRIRTPERIGCVKLRIALYYGNHLLQSFLFKAEVQNQETYYPNKIVLRTELEFSRTNSFASIESFKPRALSIGVNQQSGFSTHELIVKADNASGELALFPATFEGPYNQFRKELEKAVLDPTHPNRPRVFPPVSPGQPAPVDVATFLRQWMKTGSDLYSALLNKTPAKLRPVLYRLRQSKGQKIQAVRFDENFLFPWGLLYDYLLPGQVVGTQDPPVCLGKKVDVNGLVVECDHDDTIPGYCIKGFWAVRHIVEELIRRTSETVTSVPKLTADSVRFVGDPSLTETPLLDADLKIGVGTGQVTQGPPNRNPLLNLLWQNQPAQRPSILIFFSHMETSMISGHPKEPHITVGPNEYLTVSDINQQRIQVPDVWDTPRSIVFMMACESATTKVETLNDFVTAWNGAGAAAVVGTEALVASDMAAKCAGEVVKSLWNGATLGESFSGFRKKLLEAGNPLGFLFQAVGDVDLVVQ